MRLYVREYGISRPSGWSFKDLIRTVVLFYDDDDFSLLQPKAFFTSGLIYWRVLSILTNPYQELTI